MPEAFVVVDQELIVLAMTNIMVNAIEAMEPGKGELTLQGAGIQGKGVGRYQGQRQRHVGGRVLERLFDFLLTDRPGGLGLGPHRHHKSV